MGKPKYPASQSVDFSNYNPYYNDISDYLKACNKARFLFTETRDLEPFSTTVTILVNTTNPYLKSSFNIMDRSGKKKKVKIQEAINEIHEFMIDYSVVKRHFRNSKNKIANSKRMRFIQEEARVLNILDKIQRIIVTDLSRHKILPKMTKDVVDDDDGLPFT